MQKLLITLQLPKLHTQWTLVTLSSYKEEVPNLDFNQIYTCFIFNSIISLHTAVFKSYSFLSNVFIIKLQLVHRYDSTPRS